VKTHLSLIIVALISIVASYRLYRPGIFSMSDDMHVFRQQQFNLCLQDGQIPCRFIRDGGLGYGYPLFNYYPPLSYVFGQIFHSLGLSYVESIKLVFVFTLIIGTFSAYLLGNKLYGQLGGLIVSVVFSLAPYRAVDVFVRGALAESLALNLVPLFFYFGILLANTTTKINYFFYCLTTTALLLSHNLFALIFIPLFLLFTIIFYPHQTKTILLAYTQSALLAAFFVIPAILERGLVTIETMTQGYFQYTAHFATIKQLFFDRSWGFGASLWGPKDDMSFQIGLLQWFLPLISFVLRRNKITSFFLASSLFFLFLTHSRSTPIWQALPFMAYFQFPWRFLGPTIFCLSLASGGLATAFQKKQQFFLTLIVIILTIFLNFSYFREDIWFPHLTDQEKLNTENTFKQSNAGLQDYWPKFGNTYPKTFAPASPTILSGQVDIKSYTKKSNSSETYLTVTTPAVIVLPQVYFPKMTLTDNDTPHNYQLDPSLGLVTTKLEPGNHHLVLKLSNTLIRTFANTLSLAGLLSLSLPFFLLKNET